MADEFAPRGIERQSPAQPRTGSHLEDQAADQRVRDSASYARQAGVASRPASASVRAGGMPPSTRAMSVVSTSYGLVPAGRTALSAPLAAAAPWRQAVVQTAEARIRTRAMRQVVV